MLLGEEIHLLGNWCNLYFIENNGMAFGMQFAGNYGKLILTLFRIITVILILYLMFKLSKKKDCKQSMLICLSLITAGALGNILDSVFYGLIFSESTPFAHAVLFPKDGGYAPFLCGKVVDMIYCPIIKSHWPTWVPFVGGKYLEFFRPIFNIADSSITIGVFWLIFGYKNFFVNSQNNKEDNTEIAENNNEENINIQY